MKKSIIDSVKEIHSLKEEKRDDSVIVVDWKTKTILRKEEK